jgi:hypothetical protein
VGRPVMCTLMDHPVSEGDVGRNVICVAVPD